MTMKLVAFAALLPPKGNPRKTYDKASIRGLAQSIEKDGVLQNLVVRPEGKDRLRVITGRRRYLALKLLRYKGKIDDSYKVPVSVRAKLAERDADRISTVENVQREPMHPVDEAEAFAKLLQGGVDIADVAAETGISVQTVRRRLALASLADTVKAAVRAGILSLSIAEALTLGTAEQQLGWLEEIEAGAQVEAEDIRNDLLSGKPSVSMAVFPLERYSGTLSRDLFGDEETTYFDDIDEFSKLQQQAVEELADRHRAAGTPVETLNGYSPPWWQYRPAEDGESGVTVISLSPSGRVEVREGLIRHPVETRSASITTESPLAPKAKRERPRYSAGTLRYTALHQSIAVQAALLSDPRTAKEAVAAILLFGHDASPLVRLHPHEALQVLATEAPQSRGYREVAEYAEAILTPLRDSSAAGDAAGFEAWQKLMNFPGTPGDLYAVIRKLTEGELDRLIAFCVIGCFGRMVLDRAEPQESLFSQVARHLVPDMRRYWVPDRTFLSCLSRDDIKAAAIDSGASIGLLKLDTLTKNQLVEALGRYFERTANPDAELDEHDRKGRSWVPACMAFAPFETKINDTCAA